MNQLLSKAYDPKQFEKLGHQLIDLLSGYLTDNHSNQRNVNKWIKPNEQLAFWKKYQIDPDNPMSFFEEILDRSMGVHHPQYMGHQICPPAPLAALSSLVASLLNNGMAVYEMGAVSSALERIVCESVCQKIGYPEDASGFLTSGGTLANLTALLTARSVKIETDIWKKGMQQKLAVMVSEEAHYCVDRALRIMGFGDQGIIKIPVDENFKMKTELLQEYHDRAIQSGIQVMAVVGSAPSTSSGMYDNLIEIGRFCEENKLWFHIDGAHGGAAIYSEKYKKLLAGIETADSVVIDGHKMLMTPSIMTFLLYKEGKTAYQTFQQKAQYLWQQSQEEEWYNYAKRTFECTKLMMSIQFYVLQEYYGEQLFDEFVSTLYDLGQTFATLIQQRENFELAVLPDTNIVCFRHLPKGKKEVDLNQYNGQIRQLLLEENEFYLVQTNLIDKVYLRTTLMNPKTTSDLLEKLLDKIEWVGSKIIDSYS